MQSDPVSRVLYPSAGSGQAQTWSRNGGHSSGIGVAADL